MTPKCAIERRSYAPGQHGQARTRRASDYSIQLREKQKLRRMYGVQERQFRGIFRRAERQTGVTGENLLALLEQRLDNVVYRMGLAFSRRQAQQLVSHGHILVNDKKTDIPSYTTSVGDVIQVRPRSRELLAIKAAVEAAESQATVTWIDCDHEALRGSGTDKHHRILQTPSTQVSAVMNTLLAYQSMQIFVPNKTWLYHTLRPETLNN